MQLGSEAEANGGHLSALALKGGYGGHIMICRRQREIVFIYRYSAVG